MEIVATLWFLLLVNTALCHQHNRLKINKTKFIYTQLRLSIIYCKNYREERWCGGRNICDFIQILQLPGNNKYLCCSYSCLIFRLHVVKYLYMTTGTLTILLIYIQCYSFTIIWNVLLSGKLLWLSAQCLCVENGMHNQQVTSKVGSMWKI